MLQYQHKSTFRLSEHLSFFVHLRKISLIKDLAKIIKSFLYRENKMRKWLYIGCTLHSVH